MAISEPHKPLPHWIPREAARCYARVVERGGYSDSRRRQASERLFRASDLEQFWVGLQGWRTSDDGWSYLIASILNAVECVPESGSNATRKGDLDASKCEKIAIRDRQRKADSLHRKAAEKAKELANLIGQIVENDAQMPDEIYSGLALIESAIDADGMSRATCSSHFSNFKKNLSSRARARFPDPETIVRTLGSRLSLFPAGQDVFADDPWLSSNKASWRAFVRVLSAELIECRRIYGNLPNKLREADWLDLVNVLLDPDITRASVNHCLRNGK